MKKLLKRSNRVLAMLLAIIMIVTCVPIDDMHVHAAEHEHTEETAQGLSEGTAEEEIGEHIKMAEFHTLACMECYDDTFVVCEECGRCPDCAEFCESCMEYCKECHPEQGGKGEESPCENCGNCKKGDKDYCLTCGQCEDCVEICSRCGEVCVDCHSEQECNHSENDPCPECGLCKDDGTPFCGECGICEECAMWICDECQCCMECVDHCSECGGCMIDFCPEGGDHCAKCCEEKEWICEECNLCAKGRDLEFCEICGFCEECCEYNSCDECGMCAGEDGFEEHLCEECGACLLSNDVCDNCGLCLTCCREIAKEKGCECGEYCWEDLTEDDFCMECGLCLHDENVCGECETRHEECCKDLSDALGCDCDPYVCSDSLEWEEHMKTVHSELVDDYHEGCVPSSTWSYDGTYHWRKCRLCADPEHIANKGVHTFNSKRTCTVCGFVKPYDTIEILSQPKDVRGNVFTIDENGKATAVKYTFSVKAVGPNTDEKLNYQWYIRYTGKVTIDSKCEDMFGAKTDTLVTTLPEDDACLVNYGFYCVITDSSGHSAESDVAYAKMSHSYVNITKSMLGSGEWVENTDYTGAKKHVMKCVGCKQVKKSEHLFTAWDYSKIDMGVRTRVCTSCGYEHSAKWHDKHVYDHGMSFASTDTFIGQWGENVKLSYTTPSGEVKLLGYDNTYHWSTCVKDDCTIVHTDRHKWGMFIMPGKKPTPEGGTAALVRKCVDCGQDFDFDREMVWNDHLIYASKGAANKALIHEGEAFLVTADKIPGYTPSLCKARFVNSAGKTVEFLDNNGESTTFFPTKKQKDGISFLVTVPVSEEGHDYGICDIMVDIVYNKDCTHETIELIDEKEATCTTEGYTGDTVCTVCGKITRAGKTILPAGHGEEVAVTESIHKLIDPNGAYVPENWATKTVTKRFYDEEGNVIGTRWETYYLYDLQAPTTVFCDNTVRNAESVAIYPSYLDMKERGCYSGDKICSVCGEVTTKGKRSAPLHVMRRLDDVPGSTPTPTFWDHVSELGLKGYTAPTETTPGYSGDLVCLGRHEEFVYELGRILPEGTAATMHTINTPNVYNIYDDEYVIGTKGLVVPSGYKGNGYAAKGMPVTLTAFAKEGYAFVENSWKVWKGTPEIPEKDREYIKVNRGTFTMPDCEVTVICEFVSTDTVIHTVDLTDWVVPIGNGIVDRDISVPALANYKVTKVEYFLDSNYERITTDTFTVANKSFGMFVTVETINGASFDEDVKVTLNGSREYIALDDILNHEDEDEITQIRVRSELFSFTDDDLKTKPINDIKVLNLDPIEAGKEVDFDFVLRTDREEDAVVDPYIYWSVNDSWGYVYDAEEVEKGHIAHEAYEYTSRIVIPAADGYTFPKDETGIYTGNVSVPGHQVVVAFVWSDADENTPQELYIDLKTVKLPVGEVTIDKVCSFTPDSKVSTMAHASGNYVWSESMSWYDVTAKKPLFSGDTFIKGHEVYAVFNVRLSKQNVFACHWDSKLKDYVYDGEVHLPAGMQVDKAYVNNDNSTGPELIIFTMNIKIGDVFGLWMEKIPTQIYTGKAIKPEPAVYDGDTLLKKNTDYTLSYKNNTKAGYATITVKGKGNYSGTLSDNFYIKWANITSAQYPKTIYVTESSKAIKINPTVTFAGKKLKLGTDYIIEPAKITKSCKVTISGYLGSNNLKSNLSGSDTIDVIVVPAGKMINKAEISIKKSFKPTYTGSLITLGENDITVKIGKKTLVYGKDYTLDYYNNLEIGKATVTVKGIGEYQGEKKASFTITGKSIKNATVNGVQNKYYTGYEVQHPISVFMGSEELIRGEDYSVVYEKNINVGTAKVKIIGKGQYSGTITKQYKILPANLTNSDVTTVEVANPVYYEKAGAKPVVVVKTVDERGKTVTLKKGTDYTVSYANYKAVNVKTDGAWTNASKIPTATVTFKGKYKGTKSLQYEINKKDLSTCRIVVADKVYDKKSGAYKSSVALYDGSTKLVADVDYSKNIEYSIADDAEKAAGATVIVKVLAKGKNYTGSITGYYRLLSSGYDISKATVTVKKQYYSGQEIKLNSDDIKVTVGKKTLVYGTDYVLQDYSKNIAKGTATVTIVGKGNYGGKKTAKFTIRSQIMRWSYLYHSLFGK